MLLESELLTAAALPPTLQPTFSHFYPIAPLDSRPALVERAPSSAPPSGPVTSPIQGPGSHCLAAAVVCPLPKLSLRQVSPQVMPSLQFLAALLYPAAMRRLPTRPRRSLLAQSAGQPTVQHAARCRGRARQAWRGNGS